ncbi:UNVERIFIED_CONTAM: hypothetical protein Slati_2131600 [Sesamum latifolium]|uniref:Uncharacterized protein n=1 Tax=Sesamum latifolium TaxID=2727402 RepID=A0AAW2WT07_9LAMI
MGWKCSQKMSKKVRGTDRSSAASGGAGNSACFKYGSWNDLGDLCSGVFLEEGAQKLANLL